VCNSEWLPRYRCLNLVRAVRPSLVSDALDICLWGRMKSEVYKRKVDTRDELFARILNAATRINKREDQLRQHAIFAHTMRFSNFYYQL